MLWCHTHVPLYSIISEQSVLYVKFLMCLQTFSFQEYLMENISQTEPFLLLLPCDYFSPSPLVIGIFVLAQIDSIYANMSSFKGSYVIGFRYVTHYSCVEDSRYKCITGITIRSNMFGLIYSFDS